MPPMTGRVIAGRYNLQHPIGRGAMGVVWRARDQLLDRDVAVKEVVISAMIGEDEKRNAYQRTLREARTAARLSHRGVVAVYDVAEEDGRPWIVMELVPSRSLDAVLTVEGRLSAARTCRIGQQLLSALAAAHTAGVLHRDVKPSNVLIATDKIGDSWDERAVLTDFGIAQFEGDPRLTQTGMVMGSPGFTAPERIRGGDATSGSDLWSLGATLYAAVEGRGPYEQRGGAITTMSAIINEDAPVAPHAGELAPLIAALLRRDPSTRPSAGAAARMFAQVLPRLTEAPAEKPAVAHPPTALAEFVPPPAAPGVSAPVTPPKSPSRDEAPEAAGVQEPAAAAAAAEADAELAAKAVAAPGAAGSGSDAEQAAQQEPAPAKVAPKAKAETEDEAGAAAEPAAADAVAGEAKPAATLLDARPVTESDRGAETVIADDGPLGYRPTQVAIPVAREDTAAPPQPRPVPPGSGQQRNPAPPRPTPSFTASKPSDRMTPTFSAASPASPASPAQPSRPAPQAQDPRSGYGHGNAAAAAYAGSTAPYTPGAGPYAPQGGQYAGPSQQYPDLAQQYAPGSGGGRAGRRRGGARWVIWLAVAVIIAAAIGVGTALALNKNKTNENAANAGNTSTAGGTGTPAPSVADTPVKYKSVNALNDPSTVLPSGFTSYTVTAADAGSPAVAGFTIDIPSGWKEQRSGPVTDFLGPDNMKFEVDMTSQATPDMVVAAHSVEKQAVGNGTYPGYKLEAIDPVPVRHTNGAIWKFHWNFKGAGVQYTADDIFYHAPTSAGAQDYAFYFRSPSSNFDQETLPTAEKILSTFQIVTS
ncbi:serine/threonine protein kinase [Trebonia kvetii]|uniref:non-specific serine/threonine protein kinase n=1 Tax=Trebonia kvetii TaxID=2480626 RepID=A0A6P2C6U9_9ACTN|nr:serine/threonine-protein kinase [Trebonia kvetii]TVZ07162.1 serine/threonine protein kinase [Trebonia kvetii]